MHPSNKLGRSSQVFAPQKRGAKCRGANNGGSDTLYHEIHNDSVQKSSSFAPRLAESGDKCSANRGCGANFSSREWCKLVKRLRELRGKGFCFIIHRFRVKGRTYIYLKARKRSNGSLKEITLRRIHERELEKIKNIIRKIMSNYILTRKPRYSSEEKSKTKSSFKNKGKAKTSSAKESLNSTPNSIINSSSKQGSEQQNQTSGGDGDRGGVGGSVVSGVRWECSGFLVHRLVLRFVRPWVSVLLLHRFGRPRFVGRSKQYILRLGVGVGRWLSLQVNRDGSAQVFLEAGRSPLSIVEFVGFCRFFLLWLFREITGRDVGLGDFIVLAAPEFNVDLDGINLLEGLGARSLTLERYLSDIVRIYYSDPGVKTTMSQGGTRLEVQPKSYQGANLEDLVKGVAATAELPRFLSSLRKDVEEVKQLVRGGVSLRNLEKQGFADLVASRLANYLEILWRRVEERLKQWIKELAGRIAGVLQDYVNSLLQRIKVLEEENKQLRERIRELEDKLENTGKIEEYKKHPGWKKLLELATPGPDHPALINIDLERGMIYFSPELWRYIRSRTVSGSLRGLDKHLLDMVRDYHGEWAVKLLVEMQMYGGKIDVDKALSMVTVRIDKA